MSGGIVQARVAELLHAQLAGVDSRRRTRLSMVVSGMLAASSACPAQIARAVTQMLGSRAQPQSVERRIRRLQTDEQITAATCLHPLVRDYLHQVKSEELVLILDPTAKRDKQVVLMAAVWYRGRALPLAWDSWPGNVPLEGEGFWQRVERLLDTVAELLPTGVRIVWVADRAFGCPAFIDLIEARGWYYVVRILGHTRYEDHLRRHRTVCSLVQRAGQRSKCRVRAFKKAGWRRVSLVVYWGKHHDQPWCLASNLPPAWRLIQLYGRRYAIEPMFRHYKSYGWHWEQVQVRVLDHLERLMVAMAIATWLAMMLGAQYAQLQLMNLRPHRYPAVCAKQSLLSHGLSEFRRWICGSLTEAPTWRLTDWGAPAWHDQVRFRCGYLFVFINPLSQTVRP